MDADVLTHIVLWLLGFVFFFRIPVCHKKPLNSITRPTVSIIVPARNEESNIINLLRSLKGQIKVDDEIIIVDDHSEDNTAAVAKQKGARVIKSSEMPRGWTGKTWACYQGARKAAGKVIFFLDADTIIEEDGLDTILSNYIENDGVLSIQPYHEMHKLYEQFSAFFNLVLMAAMGSFTIFGKIIQPIGLFGPVIVMEKKFYLQIGGFEKVKGEILEDLAFGAEFKKQGVKLHCYGGRGTASFCMYPGGISQLVTGWSKGFAMGAAKTSIPVLIMIIAWITGAIGSTRNLLQTLIMADSSMLAIWALLYVAYAVQIYWMLYRIGDFKSYAALLFPVFLLFFLAVFSYSFIIIFIRKKISWKGRTIKLRSRGKDADLSSDSHYHND
ncbi:MAG: glycosyltransferase [Deltaproteobacteria bacterium]|nr:glycosyltransferase [Deltaproteobacteria bacterium]